MGVFIGLTGAFIHEWGPAGIILSIVYALLITLSIYDSKYACAFFVFFNKIKALLILKLFFPGFLLSQE